LIKRKRLQITGRVQGVVGELGNIVAVFADAHDAVLVVIFVAVAVLVLRQVAGRVVGQAVCTDAAVAVGQAGNTVILNEGLSTFVVRCKMGVSQ